MSAEDFKLKYVSAKIKQILADDPANIEGCRDLYLETIMEWSDYYSEFFLANPEDSAGQVLVKELVSLWISYAEFEASLRQFKKATDVYEKAMGDPIVGKKAYIAGLTSQLSAADNAKLWQDLLALIRDVTKNNSLTLDELYRDVKKEIGDASKLAALPSLDDFLNPSMSMQSDTPSAPSSPQHPSSMGLDSVTGVAESKEENAIPPPPVPPSFLPPAGAVQTSALDDLESGGGLTPEQLVRSYRHPPPVLVLHPAKLAGGFAVLSGAERADLERYLQCPLPTTPPPYPSPIVLSPQAERMLDIVEGMWYEQVLQERTAKGWGGALQTLRPTPTPDEAERKRQMNLFLVREEVLASLAHRAMFALLLEQQRLLCSVNFPYFPSSFLEALEQIPRAHLISPNKDSGQFLPPHLASTLQTQQRILSALLSLRIDGQAGIGSSMAGEGSMEDYYSLEAKKMRKRRRSVNGSDVAMQGGPAYVDPNFSSEVNL
eukprot:gene40294-49094_t